MFHKNYEDEFLKERIRTKNIFIEVALAWAFSKEKIKNNAGEGIRTLERTYRLDPESSAFGHSATPAQLC